MRAPRVHLRSLLLIVAIAGLISASLTTVLAPRRHYVPLSRVILIEVRRRFTTADAVRVVEALETAEIPAAAPGGGRDRVHLAIVILSGGDWGRFRVALRQAEIDWRDVLVAVSYEHEGWEEVLGVARAKSGRSNSAGGRPRPVTSD